MRLSKVTSEIAEQMCKLYQTEPLRNIAVRFNCAPQTVRSILAKCGVNIRTRGGRKKRQSPQQETASSGVTVGG